MGGGLLTQFVQSGFILIIPVTAAVTLRGFIVKGKDQLLREVSFSLFPVLYVLFQWWMFVLNMTLGVRVPIPVSHKV